MTVEPTPGPQKRFWVVVQFDCHPEPASFAQRGIWASRVKCRGFCDTTIARLARFLIKLHHYSILFALSIQFC